jgi:hypothetical protein
MMTEWQPIETAPKDGTEVLLFYETDMAVGLFHFRRKLWVLGYPIEIEDGDIIFPTHWMPLPEPPAQEKAND